MDKFLLEKVTKTLSLLSELKVYTDQVPQRKLITFSKNYHTQKSHHGQEVSQRNGPNTQRPENSLLLKLYQRKAGKNENL